jgi:hypothetical protein
VEPGAGFEPLVGEIRALRTFRVGPSGGLHPLFSDEPWHDGTNTARCMREDAAPHPSPDPDCRCGFYGYGDEQWLGDHPQSRHVVAVIACWGRIIVGTRGVRAEHCRIEALWLSTAVPADLAARVRRNHPSVAIHQDRERMLTEHPPTALDCYEQPGPANSRRARRGWWLAAAAVAVLGVLPADLLGGGRSAAWLWGVLAVVSGGTALLLRRRTGAAVPGPRLLCLAAALELCASFAGPFGLVFVRLPLLEAAAVAGLRQACLIVEGRRIPAALH